MEIDWAKSNRPDDAAKQKPLDWGNPNKEAKQVNAKANTKSGVKMTVAKGFRFGGRKVAVTETAFA